MHLIIKTREYSLDFFLIFFAILMSHKISFKKDYFRFKKDSERWRKKVRIFRGNREVTK